MVTTTEVTQLKRQRIGLTAKWSDMIGRVTVHTAPATNSLESSKTDQTPLIRSRTFILLIAFLSGIAVTAMEISASRIVAPFVGSSSIVWTNVIGVVLAALSIGYYLGGRLAEKRPDLDVLLRIILATGIFFLAVPYFASPVIKGLLAVTPSRSPFAQIFLGSALITTVLFGLPLIVLGMVSPFLIKLYAAAPDSKVGVAAGSISALSTAGSIIGTFLPTLWLIPQFGTRRTILVFACLLVVLALTGLVSKNPKLACIGLVILPVFYPHISSIRADSRTLYETESAYQYMQVRQDTRGVRYLMFNQERGVQSFYDPKHVLTGYYYDYCALLPYLQGYHAGNQFHVLLIGLAGAAITREFKYFFGDDADIDAVEVDPQAIGISKKYFDLDAQRLNVINQDGRTYLNRSSKKYDIVIVDAYQNASFIPWTLTTQEFWRQVKARMEPSGIVAINVNIWYMNPLVEAVENTQASIFQNVYRTQVIYNYMLTAANRDLNFKALPGLIRDAGQHPMAARLASQTARVPYDHNALVLTDDRAPVEFLNSQPYYIRTK
jgi:spermidine synthase